MYLVVFALGNLSGSYFGIGSIFGSCTDCEKQALLLLNGSLPDNWNHISSWIGNDCCAWHGINYNHKTGQVIHLDLQNGYLRGTMIRYILFYSIWNIWSINNSFVCYTWISEFFCFLLVSNIPQPSAKLLIMYFTLIA